MKRHTTLNTIGLLTICATFLPSAVNAAGFAIIENGVSGLGNAYAGGSASAEDATTVFYNPAGMARLQKNQLIAGAHNIQPEIFFTDKGSLIGGAVTIDGNNGGDAGEDAVVPNFFYMNNINSKVDFGLGINAPFGLTTNYQADWVGRYHALKSELLTVNINPALSFKINDKLSLGFGLNYQTAEVNLTSNIDQPTICAGLVSKGFVDYGPCAGAPQSNDGLADISGDSTSWGVNFGMLYQFSKDSRLGFAYRSNVRHDLSGNAKFSNIDPTLTSGNSAGNFFVDSPVTATANLPAIWSLSYFHALSPAWDIMADYTLTEWSSLPELRIDYATSNNQGSTIEELDWQDSQRISVGATFHASDTLAIRFGYAMDESPVASAETASARVPDADRTWLALGANYSFSKTMSVDVGYAMLSLDDAEIDRTNSTGANLKGSYDSEVNILSAQFNWDF